MANTTFNTRIKLKYDTLANWTTNKAKVLLAGEVGLCYVPSVTSGTTTTAPTVLFKVGDGKTTWENLPWGSGLAADVYDWAKKATPDYNDLANKPTIPVDTNTTYKLVADANDGHKFTLQSQEKDSTTWSTVSTITIPDNNSNQTIKVGSTTFGASDAVELKAGTGITLTPDATGKTITIAASKPASASSADKVANTLTLKAGSNSKTFNGSAATTFEIKASDLGLGNALHYIGTATVAIAEDSTTDPKIDGYTFADAQKGDVILYNHLEFVWDGAKWEKLGDDSSYALKGHSHDISASDDGVITLTGGALKVSGSHAKKGPAGGATKGATADVSVSGFGSSGSIKVPKVVVDEYGHTTGLTEQTLTISIPAAPATPTLDKVGANTSANYVIFDCGSSTVNI